MALAQWLKNLFGQEEKDLKAAGLTAPVSGTSALQPSPSGSAPSPLPGLAGLLGLGVATTRSLRDIEAEAGMVRDPVTGLLKPAPAPTGMGDLRAAESPTTTTGMGNVRAAESPASAPAFNPALPTMTPSAPPVNSAPVFNPAMPQYMPAQTNTGLPQMPVPPPAAGVSTASAPKPAVAPPAPVAPPVPTAPPVSTSPLALPGLESIKTPAQLASAAGTGTDPVLEAEAKRAYDAFQSRVYAGGNPDFDERSAPSVKVTYTGKTREPDTGKPAAADIGKASTGGTAGTVAQGKAGTGASTGTATGTGPGGTTPPTGGKPVGLGDVRATEGSTNAPGNTTPPGMGDVRAVDVTPVAKPALEPPPPFTPTATATTLPDNRTVALLGLPKFTPPSPGNVTGRGAIPTPPAINPGNVGLHLAATGIAPTTDLPTVPTRTPGTFADYLSQNGTDLLNPDQMAEEARRIRELRTGGERSQVEQAQTAAQARLQQAMAQAGTGKEAALQGLDDALRREIERVQASAMRGGLGFAGGLTSNIPIEREFNPLLQRYAVERGAIDERIQNQINQLRLEAELGSQEAARRLADLEREGGLIEQQSLADLQARERSFGESARQSRFGEFAGIEGLERAASQDTFANQAALASLQEALRQNRGDEFFRQAGLDMQANQQNFGNQLAQSQLQEGMRQSDIENNRQSQAQYLQQYGLQAGLGLDVDRLNDQLISSELQRSLSRGESAREDTLFPLQQQLMSAQIQNSLAEALRNRASAQSGGFAADDAYTITSNIGNEMAALAGRVTSGQIPPEAAKALVEQARSDYDRIRGAGAFDRIYGGIVQGVTTKPPSTTETGGVFEANKAAAQQRVAALDTEIADAEAIYAASAKDPAWLQTWGKSRAEAIAAKKAERDRLKQQYSF